MGKSLKWGFGIFALLFLTFGMIKVLSPFKEQKKGRSRSPVFYPLEEKRFAIIIPSYNNSAYCERNLRSVFEQDYKNYRVIYIDDNSSDDTLTKVKDFIAASPKKPRITLIHNEKNRGALANLYLAIQSCEDSEIVVTVDGDDFLAHPRVLARLNRAYANPEVWMTYGNFVNYPSYIQKPVICKKIPKSVIQNNSFRSHEWVASHLRTFYAGLFKQIKLQHLIYNGKFFPMGWDVAMMTPMLEMSGKHALFIRDVLYLYNRENPLNDHKVDFRLQSACAHLVKKFPRYERLKQLLPSTSKNNPDAADLITFSDNHPAQLLAFLDSVQKHVNNIHTHFVIYHAKEKKGYEECQKLYPHIQFIPFEENTFKHQFLNLLSEISSSRYVAFSTDDLPLKTSIDLKPCMQALQKTGAYGFYLTRTHASSSPIFLGEALYAWQFKEEQSLPLEIALYDKEEIAKDLNKIFFHDLSSLKKEWPTKKKSKKLGLYKNF